MVRFSFSPGANRQSRKDRTEQATQREAEAEKSRRRNFGFLKTGEKRMSTTTLNRTREHAKQLALVYSDPVETPTSVNSGQGLLAFGAGEETFDPFGNQNAFNPEHSFSTKRTVTNASASILDQHFASSTRQEREPTTSTQDSFETASVGSAYDMDFIPAKQKSNFFASPSNRRSKKKSTLGQFVESTRSPATGPGSFSGESFDRSREEQRSVISMPTIPSNSSMQASFARQNSASSSGSVSGAAARRRFRNQMRQSSNSSVSSSVDDAASCHSGTATPPESPASSTRNITGPNSRNRVAAYQRSQSNSFVSQASSANNSHQSGSDTSPNLFDSRVMDGGFTFDAFGLDQSQVEREVNEAMRALAGQGMPGFSVFFNNDADEFPMQTWDSPGNSRLSSPAPSDSEQDGFVDGFRVTQATPSRGTTYTNTSPVSSSERSFSSPASRRLVRAQGRETTATSTPPRWEVAKKGDIFGAPVSNPWKEDPWGSGDDDREFSDSGVSDFGGTQSEILGTSFAASPQFEAHFETKSDIGTRTTYQKSVSFRPDVRSPKQSRQSTSPRHQLVDGHEDDDVSSDDSAMMQEDLAREYAQEFVQRMSPRHAQQQQQQQTHDYGQPSRSTYNYGDQFAAPQDQKYTSAQDEMFEAEFGNSGPQSDFSGDDQQSGFGAFGAASHHQYPTEGEQHYHEEYDHDAFDQEDYGPPSYPRNSQPPESTETRFSSFRSKYELSRKTSVSSSSDGANTESDPIQTQSEPTYDYGGLQGTNDVAKNRSTVDTTTTRSNVPAWKQATPFTSGRADYGAGRSASSNNYSLGSRRDEDETPSENSSSRVEEKKDEEDSSSAAPSAKVNNLRSKWQQWESKSTVAPPAPAPSQNVPKWKRPNQGVQHAALTGVEMLTPDIVEARRKEKLKSRAEELRRASQDPMPPGMLHSVSSHETSASVSQQRANECHDERSSFASLRERLRPSAVATKAKSEVGTGYRSSIASSDADRLRQESPRPISGSKSDVEVGSPSFLAGVKLRKTGSSVFEDEAGNDEHDLQSPRQPTTPKSPYASQNTRQQHATDNVKSEAPTERKLTYRERREMELRREQEEKAKLEAQKEQPKKDVAAMIRQRIAANKQKTDGPSTSGGSQQLAQFRSNLKPVETSQHSSSVPSWQQRNGVKQPSPTHAGEQPQPPPRFQPTSQSSPRFSNASRESSEYAYDEKEQQQSAMFDDLSPASGGTNLTYSTDNSAPRDDVYSNQKSPARQPSPRLQPSPRQSESPRLGEERFATSNRLDFLLNKKSTSTHKRTFDDDTPSSPVPKPVNKKEFQLDDDAAGKNDVKAMLSSFLGARNNPLASLPAPKNEDDADAIMYAKKFEGSPEKAPTTPPPPPPPGAIGNGQRPALKDDPKYERYFRMLKVGMPMEVVKHAMQKDGNDPSVMDGDHNKPVGLPLKEDPKYAKYFKMLKMGISMPQVKHAMERDGLMPEVMDQDHNLPALACENMSKSEPKEHDTHRRARLHWKTLQKVTRNSLWSKIEPEVSQIDFDEEEFKELFQADMTSSVKSPKGVGANRKKGAAVRVIDAKRANNGGIILARVKMSHDEMADAVDRIDGDALTAEQIENIIEFLPTKEERMMLEKYMLEGGQDAAEKFDGLCECEKFMVSMMTVKHAKRKVSALLFKLQFISCLQSIAEDAHLIEDACDELKNSTRLRQLLGIVLQFGNRLNTAGKASKNKAGAFTLDSLLKLSQAKAFDKKTTFLHYVVMIVHRNNEILLNFTDDLPTVMKADKVYWDQCLQDLEEVENQLENVRRISLYEAKARKQNRQSRHHDDDESLGDIELTLEEEVEALRGTPTGLFTLSAIKQVSALRDKVEATRNKFIRALEYFGEDKDSMQPHELFNIFCVFGRDFNKAKEEAFANMKKKQREERKRAGRNSNPNPNSNHGKPPSGPDRKTTLRASSMQPNMSKVINDFKAPPKQHRPAPSPPRHEYQRSQSMPEANDYRSDYNSNQRMAQHEEATGNQGGNQHESQHYGDMGRSAPHPSRSPRNSSQDFLAPRAEMPEVPVPRGMQESGRFEDATPPSHYVQTMNQPVPVPRGMQESGRFEDATPSSHYEQAMNQTAPSSEASAADAIRQKARQRRQRQMQVVTGRTTPIVSNTSVPESRSPQSSPIVPEQSADHGNHASSPSQRTALRHRRLQAMKRVNASRNSAAVPTKS